MKKQGFISDSQYTKAKKVAMKDEGVVSQKEYEKQIQTNTARLSMKS